MSSIALSTRGTENEIWTKRLRKAEDLRIVIIRGLGASDCILWRYGRSCISEGVPGLMVAVLTGHGSLFCDTPILNNSGW